MKACKPEALRLKQEWEALNLKPKVQPEPGQDQNLDKMPTEPERGKDKGKLRFLSRLKEEKCLPKSERGKDKDKLRFPSRVKEEDLKLEKQAKKASKRKRE